MTELEIKTTRDIIDNNCEGYGLYINASVNKQWISKESLIKLLDENQSGEGSKQLLIYIIKKELEKKK